MKLTDNQEKMDLVARLVKEGAIDFMEAVKLLEVEDVGGSGAPVFVPWTQPIIDPVYPQPIGTGQPWWEVPYGVTCYGQIGSEIFEFPKPPEPKYSA
jgi:hypothetical protein